MFKERADNSYVQREDRQPFVQRENRPHICLKRGQTTHLFKERIDSSFV